MPLTVGHGDVVSAGTPRHWSASLPQRRMVGASTPRCFQTVSSYHRKFIAEMLLSVTSSACYLITGVTYRRGLCFLPLTCVPPSLNPLMVKLNTCSVSLAVNAATFTNSTSEVLRPWMSIQRCLRPQGRRGWLRHRSVNTAVTVTTPPTSASSGATLVASASNSAND
ncbi:hypothetical protein O9992_29530 [Vibrio lentus]|nr:hypothetical protein [Vibrio lentus]